MKRKIVIIAVVLWSCVLFFFSGQSGTSSGELSLSLAEWVLKLFPYLNVDVLTLDQLLRKIAHFTIFAVEGFLVFCVLHSVFHGRKWLVPAAGGISAVLGTLNELHQLMAVERSCQISDVLLDSAGGFTGAGFGAIIVWMLHKLDRRPQV